MRGVKLFQIKITEDIDIVDEERCSVLCEPCACLADTSTRVQQLRTLVADADCHPLDGMPGHVVDYQLSKVVHIDDHFGVSASRQLVQHMRQHGFTLYFNQCLRTVVRQRFEPCAKACCKYQCFHSNVFCMFCSRCISSTFTPYFSWRWCAKCSAE